MMQEISCYHVVSGHVIVGIITLVFFVFQDFSSDTLDRLIRKLTFALSSQASLQGSMLPAAKRYISNCRGMQRRKNFNTLSQCDC